MKRINNKSEADDLYKIINSHIDEYIEKWNISPIKLKSYFSKKNKTDNFLNRTGLNDIDRVRTILNDVIEDREAMFKDNIMKFDKFIIKESISLPEVNVELEKVLADCFHTSLSHVEIGDEKIHEYKVKDIDEDLNIVIFSQEDVDSFKDQIQKELIKQIKKSDVDMYKIDLGLESKKEIKVKFSSILENIIDEKKLESSVGDFLTNTKLLEVISDWLNDYPVLKSGKKWKWHKKFKEHYFWKKESK